MRPDVAEQMKESNGAAVEVVDGLESVSSVDMAGVRPMFCNDSIA